MPYITIALLLAMSMLPYAETQPSVNQSPEERREAELQQAMALREQEAKRQAEASHMERPYLADEEPTTRSQAKISTSLAITVLAFGLGMSLCMCFLLIRRPNWDANWAMKLIGLPLVISAALFLIVAGFEKAQIEGAMTLLGTIAGYLLGKGGKSSTAASAQNDQSPTLPKSIGPRNG